MKLLSGIDLSNKLNESSKNELFQILQIKKTYPTLGIVIIGDKYASRIYIRNKIRKCNYVGIKTKLFEYSKNISEEQLIINLKKINCDNNITSYIVQFPLPEHISKEKICSIIPLEKDADGLGIANKNLVKKNDPRMIIPCTPNAILLLLKHFSISIYDKNIVVIGKGDIVGKPLATMFKHIPCKSFIICDKKTKNISKYTKQADLLISATGKNNLIYGEIIKNNSVLIDVGITIDKNNKLSGDIDFDSVKNKVSYITPVPKGIGPITISCLIMNVIKLYKN